MDIQLAINLCSVPQDGPKREMKGRTHSTNRVSLEKTSTFGSRLPLNTPTMNSVNNSTDFLNRAAIHGFACIMIHNGLTPNSKMLLETYGMDNDT